MRGYAVRTPELVARAVALRAEGKMLREIGEEMGVSTQAVHEWVTDPDGAKRAARKAGYMGTCERCGAPTNGSDGPGKAAKVCDPCYRARNAERNARILEAWERGETAVAIAAREGLNRHTVAGLIDFRRRRCGDDSIPLHRRRSRDVWPYIQLRWNLDGATGAEIADELGTTETNVGMMIRTMREAGVYVARRASSRRAAA